MEEMEKTREELVETINELALEEVHDLPAEVSEDDGSSDMLVGAALGAGLSMLIGGGIWLFNRHKKKKAEKLAKRREEEEAAEDVGYAEYVEIEPEEPVEPEKEEKAPEKGKGK